MSVTWCTGGNNINNINNKFINVGQLLHELHVLIPNEGRWNRCSGRRRRPERVRV